MNDRDLEDFGLRVGFAGDRAVLAVQGDVDVLTAPTLADVLLALVDEGHPDVVVDLAACSFLGAAGLRVIADAAERVKAGGSVLSVRSPGVLTRRVLQITGVAELVLLEEPPAPGPSGRRPEGTRPARHQPAPVPDPAGSDPHGDAAVGAVLGLVAALAGGTVPGTDGVSVTLERLGRLSTVASSDEIVAGLDARQYETGEGPCVDAAILGRSSYVESVTAERRWAAFLPHAARRGVASILSVPLRGRSRPIGALNLYARTDKAFGSRAQELAGLLATYTSSVVADAEPAGEG